VRYLGCGCVTMAILSVVLLAGGLLLLGDRLTW